jgi:hypothetical protein
MSGSIFARGVAKTLAVLQETSYGVQPTGTAQLLRRTQSTMDLQVQDIASQEILESGQVRDARQGPRQVQGQLAGYLSPLTYQLMFENLFRSTFALGASLISVTDSTISIDSTTGVVTLGVTNENFLTSGFKVGDVIQITGASGSASADTGVYLVTTSVSATTITTAPPNAGISLAAYSTGQTVGISVVGKKLTMPSTLAAQSLASLSFEHYYSDIGVSEVATGCRVTSVSLSVPPNGYANFAAQFLGQNLSEYTTQQFTNPTPETSTPLLTATDGRLIYKGAPVAALTGFNLQISTQADATPVVGSNIVPDVFVGTMMASGSFTALFEDSSITSDFLNEAEFSIQMLLTGSNAANPEFVSINLPRVKIFSDNKNDSDREIVRSVNFRALEQSVLGGVGLAYDDTTVVIQDSMAA